MKAALFVRPREIEIRELPVPRPARNEALVKVLGCGVCGTDAHIYSGEISNARPPVVLGHELFGEVEDIGPGVIGLRPGDRVVIDPFVYCGHCPPCRRADYRFCSNELFVGYHLNGGFSQYTVVPFTNLYHLPPSMDCDQAVLVETLATVVAGFSRLNPQPGRSVLILGAGTVGLLWNQLLRRSLSVFLLQSEIVPSRLRQAGGFGADRLISPQTEDLQSAVRELCPEGVDYLVDTTGSTAAIEQALPTLKRGGTLMCFGICPKDEKLSLSLNWFYRQQLTVLTSRRPPREMTRAIELLDRGVVKAQGIVTGHYRLEQIEQTFQLFEAGRDREIKMAIDPWIRGPAPGS